MYAIDTIGIIDIRESVISNTEMVENGKIFSMKRTCYNDPTKMFYNWPTPSLVMPGSQKAIIREPVEAKI